MTRPRALKVFMIVGEASGDKLAAAVMRSLRTMVPDVEFRGLAGPLMQAQGMQSLFPIEELSVMGLVEILPKYRRLKALIDQTATAAVDWSPDVVLSVDSPDFSFRVAKKIKAVSPIRTVHYVAPSVWAWRPKRAEKLRGVIDHLLALLPFEPPYFTDFAVDCDFVGHPVAGEAAITEAQKRAFRDQHGIEGPLVAVLPGSRLSEVRRLLPKMISAVEQSTLGPRCSIVIPTLPHLSRSIPAHTDAGAPLLVLDGAGLSSEEAYHQRRIAMAACDVALAASGTVSLELASVGTPMVIGYDMNRLTFHIMRWMARIDTVTLVNIVAKSRTVEEFLGPAFQPHLMSGALNRIIDDSTAQREAMATTMGRLRAERLAGSDRSSDPDGTNDPARCASEAILRGIGWRDP